MQKATLGLLYLLQQSISSLGSRATPPEKQEPHTTGPGRRSLPNAVPAEAAEACLLPSRKAAGRA